MQPKLTDGIIAQLAHLPRDPYTDEVLAAAERMEVRQAAVSFVPREGTLSEREQGVLHYLATRLTTREIADELYISMNTLKSHLKSIYRKLDATSRADAVTQRPWDGHALSSSPAQSSTRLPSPVAIDERITRRGVMTHTPR